MRPPDPDRQVELVELLAALDVAESLSLHDPIAMYLREVASVEPLSRNMERELLAALRRGDEAARIKLTQPNLHLPAQLGAADDRPTLLGGVSGLPPSRQPRYF